MRIGRKPLGLAPSETAVSFDISTGCTAALLIFQPSCGLHAPSRFCFRATLSLSSPTLFGLLFLVHGHWQAAAVELGGNEALGSDPVSRGQLRR